MSERTLKPAGHWLTPRSTPTHIAELLLVLMRAAFAEIGGDTFPFKYTKDSATTKIFIDTPFNLATKQLGGKPMLIVARGPAAVAKQVLNHRAGQSLNTGSQSKTTLADAGFEIRCISKKPEEAEILANEVTNILVTCSELLPKITSIHDIRGINLGVVGKMEQDETVYACSVLMSCGIRYLWVDIPEQNILKAIQLTLNETTTLIE